MVKNKGFTLIEITLVIILIAILLAITTPLVSSVVIRSDLVSSHESLYNTLLRAQQLSKNQYKDSQWRVCINNTSKTYTITAGTCTNTQYPEIITINSGITVSSEQTLDIPFKLINGELDLSNDSIKIDLTGGGVSKSIIINKSGVINKEATTELQSNTTTPSIVTNGLVLHLDAGNINSYPGLNTAQNTWFDLSGNGNNGTLVNGVAFNGANGGALVFDGVKDYINLGSFFNYQSFTISLWVNPGLTQVQYADIFDNNHTGFRNFVLQQNNLSTNQYSFGVGDSSGGISSSGLINLVPNTWTNLAFTFSPSTRVTAYINGVLHSQGAIAGGRNILYQSQNLSLARWSAGGRHWNGIISNFIVYNRELTPEEIPQNFNATKGRFGL
jgi:prepilin-type N-terminal cleavage/methylation domain-containing protein